jgi:hypothetical protein
LRRAVLPQEAQLEGAADPNETIKGVVADCAPVRVATIPSDVMARRAFAGSTDTTVDALQPHSMARVSAEVAPMSSGTQSPMGTGIGGEPGSARLSRSEAIALMRAMAVRISSRFCLTDSVPTADSVASSAYPWSGTAILFSSCPTIAAKMPIPVAAEAGGVSVRLMVYTRAP